MPKGLKRTLYALSLALGFYSLLGFLILPGVAQRVANQQLAHWATVPGHWNGWNSIPSAWSCACGAYVSARPSGNGSRASRWKLLSRADVPVNTTQRKP